MKDIFISIDPDYFNDEEYDSYWISTPGWGPPPAFPARTKILQSVFRLLDSAAVPIHAFTNHEQMLPVVTATKARKLVNFDAHSDLPDTNARHLNCGTWVGYVPWRKSGEYHWITSDAASNGCTGAASGMRGDCNGLYPIFHSSGTVFSELSDWRHIQMTVLPYRECIPVLEAMMSEVAAVGICMSPSYSAPSAMRYVRDNCRRRGIKVMRGIQDEDMWNGIDITPKEYGKQFR